MDSVYTAPQLLPAAVLSFYRWLWKWHSETQDVHPSTGYFARKQRRNERTIYRWIAALKAAGWISVDTTPGVMRQIVPLIEPPAAPRATRPQTRPQTSSQLPNSHQAPDQQPNNVTTSAPLRNESPSPAASNSPTNQPDQAGMSGVVSGVMSGVVSGVPPYTDAGNAVNAETTTDAEPAAPVESVPAAPVNPVPAGAGVLVSAGVPQPIAVKLALSRSPEAVQNAVSALKEAKGVRNPVGWLVAAIEQEYQFSPKEALHARVEARRTVHALPAPAPVNGLTGRAAFEALRSKLALAGRVSA